MAMLHLVAVLEDTDEPQHLGLNYTEFSPELFEVFDGEKKREALALFKQLAELLSGFEVARINVEVND